MNKLIEEAEEYLSLIPDECKGERGNNFLVLIQRLVEALKETEWAEVTDVAPPEGDYITYWSDGDLEVMNSVKEMSWFEGVPFCNSVMLKYKSISPPED